MKKITISADFAHFKVPYASKVQKTYPIPPISTVIGILKNIYNHDIDSFVFGYLFSSKNKFRDIQKIYKEINIQKKKESDRYDKASNTWVSDVPIIEYLYDPKLIIYTDIKDEPNLSEIINLGKTDCLAKVSIKDIKLYEKLGCVINQWTSLKYGDGLIKRISVETVWNQEKGIYDIYTDMFRYNIEVEYPYNFDIEEEQNVFLWSYRKRGNISEYTCNV